MSRSALLRAAVFSAFAASASLATPALAQSLGAPLTGDSVGYASRAWVDDGRTVAQATPTAPAYNLDPGFVYGARSAFPSAAVRTPLAGGTGLAVRGNEP